MKQWSKVFQKPQKTGHWRGKLLIFFKCVKDKQEAKASSSAQNPTFSLYLVIIHA